MKKFFNILIMILVLLANNYCFAVVINNQEVFPPYAKFYDYNANVLKMQFIKYEKKDFQQLSKEEKKIYKHCMKIEKLLDKNNYKKAYKYNPDFLPTWVRIYNYAAKQDIEKEALNALKAIENINNNDHIFEQETIDSHLGMEYYLNKEYKMAIPYLEKDYNYMVKENLTDSDWYYYLLSFLAESYYWTYNYEKVIKYASMIPKNKKDYLRAQNLLYSVYLTKNDLAKAYKVALILFDNKYPNTAEAAMNVQRATTDINTKLKYIEKKKKNTTYNSNIMYSIKLVLTSIDKQLIDSASKTIKGYFTKPDWEIIVSQDRKLMTAEDETNRFWDFHYDISNCISKYKGNDLKMCFANINQKQEKLTQRLILEQQERNRQIAEAERIRQLQMINVNLQQANYLQEQQNYQMQQLQNRNIYTHCYRSGNQVYCNSY